MKKYVVVWGSMFFIVGFVSLYLMMEAVNTGQKGPSATGIDVDAKIKEIQMQIKKNEDLIRKIRVLVKEMSQSDPETVNKLKKIIEESENSKLDNLGDADQLKDEKLTFQNADKILQQVHVDSVKSHGEISVSGKVCSLADAPVVKSEVKMLQLMDIMPFDNPDGGVWKQGWDIKYSESDWSDSKKLYIFVVPHSHNDPGWVKTFDDYYDQQVRHILNVMLHKMEEDPRRKFIEAEMSFFSKWWHDIDEDQRQRVKKVIEKGQLEIVTGGWVMTDEASAHYFAMVDQLVEGHLWLNGTIGVKPNSGWAVDPFGYSPTMAYILKRAGLNNMLIQRVHYVFKKVLAREKQLEFMWRQHWDQTGSTDMFCHAMPFYSYDIPHTCGPDPKICCQFDFARMSSRYNCPWHVPPVAITESNVADRSKMLLDQYKKKAQLYRSNVLLIPLGDDFRYDKEDEAQKQFSNYQKIFDHINSHREYHTQAQFGTLSDYFNKLYEETNSEPGQKPENFPVLSGDFFTYADRDDHYWSGYFTSRPFYKRLDRILESSLRSAEILFSMATAYSRLLSASSLDGQMLMEKLVNARRNIGLFQHHDAITGTAKDFVVVDYGQRLLDALMDTKKVITGCAQFLVLEQKDKHEPDALHYHLDEIRESHDSLPNENVLAIEFKDKSVLFINSLAVPREQVVTVYLTSPFVEVTAPDGAVVTAQVNPCWSKADIMSNTKFSVSFVVSVPALGIARYNIRKVQPEDAKHTSFGTTVVYSVTPGESKYRFPFTVKHEAPADFFLENNNLKAEFNGKTGFLQTITTKPDNEKHRAQIHFVKYGARGGKEKSGAYLFIPDGPGRPLDEALVPVRVTKGPVVSEATVFLRNVQHRVRLFSSPGADGLGVDIYNLVDIRNENNFEIAMKIDTSIQNKDKEFFTDLNGFQMVKHKTFDKLPLQANVYPMTAMSYIEDDKCRFSILTAQSNGMAAHNVGQMEIMMDRRLAQDDNRGMGQGVRDNKLTPNSLMLVIEHRTAKRPTNKLIGYPSIQSHAMYQQLIHPFIVLPQKASGNMPNQKTIFKPMSEPLPCDLHLLNLRTLQNPDDNMKERFIPRKESGLLIHRLGFDCNFPNKGLQCSINDGLVTLDSLFKDLKMSKATETSLTLIKEIRDVDISTPQTLKPMEIYSYIVQIQ